MKKLLLIGLIIFLSACQENAVQKKQTDYDGLVTSLEATYKNTFAVALKSAPDNVYADTYSYLKQNYFKGDLQLDPNKLKALSSSGARISSASDLDLSFLTEEQKTLVIPFFDAILNQTDLSVVSDLTDQFNNAIISSLLNEEQKYQLFSIGTAIKVSIKVIEDASTKSSSNGRVEKIDVKGALQAGVLGLATGAIGGCYTGATGGTVAFPLLGTATGCVGGAVLGGAMGFIGGVTMSIVQNLLFD